MLGDEKGRHLYLLLKRITLNFILTEPILLFFTYFHWILEIIRTMDETVQPAEFFKIHSREGFKLRSLLSKISSGLKLYEKLSIIFLICETPHMGIAKMEEILRTSCTSAQNDLFYKWLRQQKIFAHDNWDVEFAEVLAVIQNYRLGRILGFTKKELIERFMPKNNFKTHSMSSIRKVLYNLCEELKTDECRQLIRYIEKSQNLGDTFKCKILEYKLLTWNNEGFINLKNNKPNDLQVLINYLKVLNLKNFVYDIEIIVESRNCQMVRSKSLLKSERELAEYYEIIDSKYLGLCVLINEKNFSSSMFPKRLGSDKDAERLTEVFTAFGFDVKLHVDLTYKKLLSTLCFYAKTVNKISSFFVLIILSHGSENHIFTSDSLPVDMNTIEMIFQAEVCPNLIGKPKIFIIQSCQGERWQTFVQVTKADVEMDNAGPSEAKQMISLGPQKGDSMIAWSTVQGFASFRDRYNGSWYIQELCNELWKFGDAFDLVEILTKVNNNLRSKVYDGQFMVPSLLLSLRAKVLFPSLKENFSKGRKLMFERLIFEKYFREFLSSRQQMFRIEHFFQKTLS